MELKGNFLSDYEDFKICLDDLKEGSAGYVFDADGDVVYRVRCTVVSDRTDEYDSIDDALRAENSKAGFDYTAEFITDDVDLYVGVEILSTYAQGVLSDDVRFICNNVC